jgi:hypothetical protein
MAKLTLAQLERHLFAAADILRNIERERDSAAEHLDAFLCKLECVR